MSLSEEMEFDRLVEAAGLAIPDTLHAGVLRAFVDLKTHLAVIRLHAPVGEPTGFHLDVSAFGFKGRQMPSFWLALDDIDEDNGPLVTALGSHKKVKTFYRTVYTTKPLIEGYKDLSEIYHFLDEHRFEMKVWPVKKGDVLVLHPYMAHASKPMVRKDGRRYGFSTRWMGDDVRWRPNIYTEVEADTHPTPLADGDKPPEAWCPVQWDAQQGYVGREAGVFNAFTSMEPRVGYHNMEPGYRHTQLNDNY